MKHRFAFLIAGFAFLTVLGCQKPAPDVPDKPDNPDITDPVKLEPFTFKVPVTDNWVFEQKPSITFQIGNPNDQVATAEIKVSISTDQKKAVTTIEKNLDIPAKGKEEITLTTSENLDPGFYRAYCTVSGRVARSFVFGISPFKIVSAPDKQADFDEYWAAAKAQLAAVDMNAELTEIPARSSAAQKVYLVEMQSAPDRIGGEPAVIRGYYLEPQDGEKHPVLIHFYGYDTLNSPSKLSCPSGSSNPTYAEFYLSTRGQIINHRTADKREPDGHGDFVNTYGDWFAFQFGDLDGYYYRGAFLDCVQAVRFMATRPTSDMTKLFGEGSSQGGAFSYAAAALSDYPFTAIAPCVAFLGDFPDYFNIVSWPGDVAKKNKGSMTTEEMYTFLSYFDTKNLATRISCAVIACSGLQDGTCPPHTNIAPYNNLQTSDKEYYFYPEMQHEIPSGWSTKFHAFFKARM